MEAVDLLIHSIPQMATCASPSGPKRGRSMRDSGPVADGAIAVEDGIIADVGTTRDLRGRYRAAQTIDATGHAVCPGFVDAHTHVLYAGNRIEEFEQRLAGADYLELLAAGGGILSTMRATRAADRDCLIRETQPRLDAMWSLGTTTAEVKTGYGLDLEIELRLLEALTVLDDGRPMDLVPTFLGAHAVPPEYADCPDAYAALVVGEMLPEVASWYAVSDFAARQVPLFVDVFWERGAFDTAACRCILSAARRLGLPIKAHVDEFHALGGLGLALKLGATSVDHLDVTRGAGIARLAASDTVGVLLPAVTFHLGGGRYADARAMIDAGAAIALATDCNPGSAPCPSMPLVMAIACRYQHLSPAEALNAATINAAHALGLGERIGSLERGKQADLLILAEADYRSIVYSFGGNPVAAVVKRGNVSQRQ